MTTRIAAIWLLLVLVLAGRAAAQDRHKWWADESIRKEIGLTDEQAAKAEEIFQASLPRLKDLNAQLDALEKDLSTLIRENQADETVLSAKIDAVEKVRSELSKTRVLMVYHIHKLLTPEQNEKFKVMLDRMRSERKKSSDLS